MTNTPYYDLTPDVILTAVEALNLDHKGIFYALNSYENRVYEIPLENKTSIVVKFYRPNRWTKEQIEEEHKFALNLVDEDVDVVPPLIFNSKTLFEISGFLYCVYEKRKGVPFEIRSDEDYRHMGRLVARIHQVGCSATFKKRINLNVQSYGWDNLKSLKQSGYIPENLKESYITTLEHVLNKCEEVWGDSKFSCRLHGDCHFGNILNNPIQGEIGVFFVDLDDSLSGPEIQDLWMFLNGDKFEMERQLRLLIEGYNQIRDFDYSQLRLIEVLRTLRMVHYTAWIAKRWEDPTFPQSFPFFETNTYWENHLNALKEQLYLLNEDVITPY